MNGSDALPEDNRNSEVASLPTVVSAPLCDEGISSVISAPFTGEEVSTVIAPLSDEEVFLAVASADLNSPPIDNFGDQEEGEEEEEEEDVGDEEVDGYGEVFGTEDDDESRDAAATDDMAEASGQEVSSVAAGDLQWSSDDGTEWKEPAKLYYCNGKDIKILCIACYNEGKVITKIPEKRMEAHARTHPDLKFQCPICKNAFRSNKRKQSHFKNLHPGSKKRRAK